MQSLKALQFVEDIPGPKGGYKPTAMAYEALDIQQMEKTASVPLKHNGEPAEDLIVEEIDLSTVHHSEICRAEINIQGRINSISESDIITVGPTPISNLVLDGQIEGKDDTNNILILRVNNMTSTEAKPVN